MRDFFVPRDLLLCGSLAAVPADFSVRGFSAGQSEANSALTVTVPATLWTPAEITTALWLDAADAGTITVTGSGISQWLDKSGNSKNATQETDSYRPPLSVAGFNSLDCAAFAADWMSLVSITQSYPCHVFMAIDTTTSGTGTKCILNRYAPAAPYAPALYIGGQVSYRPEIFWGSGWTGAYSGAIRAKHIGEFILGTSVAGYRRDGGTAVTTSHSNTAATYWNQVGGDNSAQRPTCKLGEIILVNSAVDDTTRQKIEGYLAHKWGMTANLPSGHYYKSVAPTV